MDARNEQMLKRPKVCDLFATSSAGLHRGMQQGLYPRPYRQGPHSVAWKLSECLSAIERLEVAEPVQVAPGAKRGRKPRHAGTEV
jgi:predicted DNA-binding transcriptional regulator AlpA